MAATVLIKSGHGAVNLTGSPTGATTFATTETDVTSATIKFKLADNDANDTANPIVKPTSGTNYSYKKSFRIKVTVAPDGDISNLRFFASGAWATGITMRGHTLPAANYLEVTSAAQMSQGAGSALTDASTWTTGSPLTVNSGTVLTATTGYGTQDMMELQLEVGTTASRGLKGPITYTYRFDET